MYPVENKKRAKVVFLNNKTSPKKGRNLTKQFYISNIFLYICLKKKIHQKEFNLKKGSF